MSMVLMEGFDLYGDVADLRRRHVDTSSGGGSFVTGRNGTGQALSMAGASNTLYLQIPDTALSEYVIGFAWRMNDNGGTGHTMIQFREDNTVHTYVRVEVGGALTAYRNSSINFLGTSPGVILPKNWYYIEMRILIHDSTGTLDIQVDGVNVLSLSAIDTRQGLNGVINNIAFFKDNSTDPQIDDLYLLDVTGLTLNDFLGDVTIETVLPDGDGATNDFTQLSGLTNWEMVDDGATPDDDTTYNSSATVDHIDLYTGAALTVAHDTVHCVSVLNHTRKEDAGFRTVRALCRNNVTTNEGAARAAGNEYRYQEGIFETDPDGGGAWTTADVDSSQFGVTIEA